MENKFTASEIIENMKIDDDSLPEFTIEQLILANKGIDSFIEDGIIFADSENSEIPIPIYSIGDAIAQSP